MISVIIFDLGNVILPVDGQRLAEKLASYSSISSDKILNCFGNELILNDFETGQLTPPAFFEQIKKCANLKNLEFDQFVDFFNDIFEEDPHIVQLLARLKTRYKLGLISNTNTIHAQYLLNRFSLFDHFDELWFSHEHGVRKPHPSIYQKAINHFSVSPSQTVFIDDLKVNVDGASQLGMRGIHFENYNQLAQNLQELGVAI